MTARLFYVGVKALITNDEEKILLLKADVRGHTIEIDPYWDVPGGKIEENQSIIETLRREVFEEIGVANIGEPEFLLPIISNHTVLYSSTSKAGLMLLVYKVTIPENSVITLSDEHFAYEWVSKAEAAKRLTHKYPIEFTQSII